MLEEPFPPTTGIANTLREKTGKTLALTESRTNASSTESGEMRARVVPSSSRTRWQYCADRIVMYFRILRRSHIPSLLVRAAELVLDV